jgi:hypothetical protein
VRFRMRSRADDLEPRLVWILGGPRTGSTWLLELLAYPLTPAEQEDSGAALRTPDTSVRPVAVPINEPYLGVHLAPIVTVHSVGVFTAAEARDGDASYFFDPRYEPVWRPRLRSLILERLAAQVERIAEENELDRPLAVAKEPNGSHAAPILMSTLPRSRLLFLLRDGRDVLDSLLDAMSPGGWLAGAEETEGLDSSGGRIDFLRRNAHLWVHRMIMVQRAVAAHPSELTHTVRYERLLEDTAGGLREVFDWLGVAVGEQAIAEAVAATSFEDYPAEVKGRGRPLRFASPGRWRENMSAEEQAAMLEIIGGTLEELGYER